ncbi:MAG: RNA polymerase-binding protein DksA [Helicobacter sp.]|nr:RNA polymerase-binding protein DksA [Helicobacteraceae bacterium]MDY3113536.1 RNA polymerase-binding protein DksA [Helicobacter sp.]
MKQNDLEYFNQILLEKKNAILENNLEHQKSMQHLDSSFDEADLTALQIKNTLDSSIFSHHNSELEYIESALEKLENGNYGICEMCDEEIALERLKAKPHARYCIVCREIVEKNKGLK